MSLIHRIQLHELDDSALDRLDATSDLETVLAAWHHATVRLEETHTALRAEVRRLTDELQAKNRELARKNRLADLGQFATHIAHELRNNLMPVTLYLSLLRRRLDTDPSSLPIVDKIDAGCVALDATVNDLLHFASDREPAMENFRVRAALDELFESLEPQLAAQGIRLEIDVEPSVALRADKTMFRRAVLNLAINAMDAMPDGGELSVIGVTTPTGFELEVADSGLGLTEDVSLRIFEPFFTTKNSGTGLGLAIVDRVALVHGGSVTAQNCPQGGAAFTLRFPGKIALEAAA